MMRRYVSIVLPTSNDLHYAKWCIESIRRYTRFPYQLIVVDNGSKDGTVEYLRSNNDIRLIENQENLYVAMAVGQGIEASENSQFVLIMDSDVVILEDGWLTEMVHQLESEKSIAAVGPKHATLFYERSEPEYEAVRKFKEYVLKKEWLETLIGPNEISQDQLLEILTLSSSDPNDPRFNELCGWATLYKREAICKIGLPTTKSIVGNISDFNALFSDSEYSMRALVFGYTLENSPTVNGPKAKVHHFGGRSRLFYKDPLAYQKRIKDDQEHIRTLRLKRMLEKIHENTMS